MPIQRLTFIYRRDLEHARHENKLFVFGDNLALWGEAGQAKEMRGEPNAIGLPTKRAWNAYLTNADLSEVKAVIAPDLLRIIACLRTHGLVVWPADGIGTGFAQLAQKAPLVREYYDGLLEELISIDGRI